MIPPTEDDKLPVWTRELRALHIPHVVGLPVCDVLHGNSYSPLHGWTIESEEYSTFPCACCKMLPPVQFVHAKHTRGSEAGALGAYYVADMTTEQGREHVRQWCEANGREMPNIGDYRP